MKKFLLAVMVSLSISFSFSGIVLAGNPTEDAKREVCTGISGQVGGSCTGGDVEIRSIVRVVLQILSWIAGIAAVIMIVISGLKYITSGGDGSSVASAKSSLIYALVGLVVVALAQAIVIFVLGSSAGQ